MYHQGDDSPEQSSSPRTHQAYSAADDWINQQSKATTLANEVYYHQLLTTTVQSKEEKEAQRKRELEQRRLAVEKAKAELDETLEKMEQKKRFDQDAEKAADSLIEFQLQEIERKKRDEDEKKKKEEQRIKDEANAAALKWIEEQESK
jgi:hypothetical protein